MFLDSTRNHDELDKIEIERSPIKLSIINKDTNQQSSLKLKDKKMHFPFASINFDQRTDIS